MTTHTSHPELLVTGDNLSVRNKPVNLVLSDARLFEHELVKPVAASRVLKLKNVAFVYDTIFDFRSFKFLKPYTHPKPEPGTFGSILRSSIRLLLLSKLLTKSTIVDKAIWITDNWSAAYFHWFTEAIPRLLASQKLIDGHVIVLPERLEKFPYIAQSLMRLKLPFKFIKPKDTVRIRELLLTSHLAETGNYHPVVINQVRNVFTTQSARPGRRIFISRQKSKNRIIANEGDVVKTLQSFGFEIHCFEDYSLERQIEIMSQTKSVVGLHGAGLTNMLFMKAGGQILELRDETDSHNNCYFSLASDLGIAYFYLLNHAEGYDSGQVRIFVDVQKLRRVLELMLSGNDS